jgi:hypothetical protein
MKTGYSDAESEDSTGQIRRAHPPEAQLEDHGICPEHPPRIEKAAPQATLKPKTPQGKKRDSVGRRSSRRAPAQTTHARGRTTEENDHLWRNRWP